MSAVVVSVPQTGVNGPVPTWVKVTLAHTAFQTAGLTNAVTVLTLPARSVVHAAFLKHSVQFAGTMPTYTISLGTGGSPLKYAAADNVFAVVGDAAFASLASALVPDLPGFSAPTAIVATATATVANLSTSTAGSIDIWLQVSVLP